MDQKARQRSLALEAVTRAVAEWTVSLHAERDPSLEERYGAGWRRAWVSDVATRLGSLGQAIAVRRPALFVESVAWSRHAFDAREGRTDDLRMSLEAMRETIESELPDDIAAAAGPMCAEAIRRLDDDGRMTSPTSAVGPASPHAETCLRYLEALLDGRAEEAEQLMIEQAEGGVPVAELYEHVLRPAQSELGRMWHLHEVSVADEHLASATTQIVMSRLRPFFPSVPRRPDRMLALSVDGDLHEIAIRMVADFFEMDGWMSFYLGCNMPASAVMEMVDARGINLLAISASTTLSVRAAGEMIDRIRADDHQTALRIIIGGAPFNFIDDLWQEVGADGHARSAPEAVELANRLVGGRTAG